MHCTCPTPGYCATLGKVQSPRMHAICQGAAAGLDARQCDGYRANWFARAIAGGKIDWGCLHRGQSIGVRIQKIEKKGCSDCLPRGQVVSVFECAQHGRCTLLPWQAGQAEAVCRDCPRREPLSPRLLSRHRFAGLLHPRFSFNNSLIRFQGRLLMAYRFSWDDARIALAELDENLNVVAQQLLPLKLGQAREDPRLWIFNGALHVSYTAVQHRGSDFWTDLCYARLEEARLESRPARPLAGQCRGGGCRQANPQWSVAAEFHPHFPGRNYWEKNWGFFEHAGALYCVYSIRPHRILKIDGASPERCRAELVATTECTFGGKLGRLHGGAPPVFHRGEFYSFYHSILGDSQDRIYAAECYTFEGRPPFRPLRHCRVPLLLPTREHRPESHVPHCVFPGGAFIDERHRWAVSFGYYDRYSELAHFDINELESFLEPIAGSPAATIAHRPRTNDLAIWKEVYGWNQYGLPERFEAGDVVVDVGAHIGSFSRSCLERGAGGVIACEPLPASFDLLAKNVADFESRVELLPVAVGGSRGRLELRNRDASGRSTVGVSGHYPQGEVVATAPLVPLSEILPAGPVRLLKLDCEGAEYEILAAAGEELDRVQEIVGEAHRLQWRGHEATIDMLVALLAPRGFVVESRPDSAETWIFTARRPAPGVC